MFARANQSYSMDLSLDDLSCAIVVLRPKDFYRSGFSNLLSREC